MPLPVLTVSASLTPIRDRRSVHVHSLRTLEHRARQWTDAQGCGAGQRAIVGTSATNPQAPDRNLALELVRVTEAAAIAAGRWMGRGDKEGADGAAVSAMRVVLQTVPMDGVVVIGEGEKDEAPMLYNGERIGDGSPPPTDIAVDPIDGTTPTALGRGGALAVISGLRGGDDVRPRPVLLHARSWPSGRRRPGPWTYPAPDREPRGGGKGHRQVRAGRDRGHPGPGPPRGAHRRGEGEPVPGSG